MDTTPQERPVLVKGEQAGLPLPLSLSVPGSPHQNQPLPDEMETKSHLRQRHQGHVRHVTQDFSIDGGCQDDQECDSSDLSLHCMDSLSRHEGEPNPLSSRALRHGQYQHTRRAPYQPTPGDIYTRLLLPSARICIVIGRGGEAIRGICDITGAHVNIASPGANHRDPAHRLVTVMGSVMAVCWAVDLLAQKAGLFEGYSNINPQHKSRKRANMPVSAPTPFSAPTCFDEKVVNCPTSAARTSNTGSSNQQGIAPTSSQVELVLSLPGIKMVIDSSKAGLLIGKAGVTITDIRMQSRARVLLLDEEQSAKEGAIERERVLIIIGIPDYCRRAHQLIIAALSARPFTPEDVLFQQERLEYRNDPREPQPTHQQPAASQAIFNDEHQHHRAAYALYSSMAYASSRYPSSEHMAMSMLSQSMAHLGMTNGYYSLSPYAALSLFPHNQPPPQVYHSAQMRAPAEFQCHQQQEMVQEEQHEQQEQQFHSQDQQEDPKLVVQGALASIPGTEKEKAQDSSCHITLTEGTQAHGSRDGESMSSPLQLSHTL